MDTNFIDISECTSEMKLAENVVNIFGTTLAFKGTVLDEHLIKKIKLNKIEQVSIFNSVRDKSQAEFKKDYKQNTLKVKEMLKDIGNGEDVDLNTLNELATDVISTTSKSGAVLNWLNHVKEVDNYTYNHSVNVSVISYMIGKWLGLPESKLLNLTYAGLLHDIGKAFVPEQILNKPGKLTEEEFEEMKRHPVYGYRQIEKMKDIPKDVAYGVLMHHERENGKGYPMGATSSQINQFAKIISVADVYDAMTSDRVYHSKSAPLNVLGMIQKETFGILDPAITMPFLNNIANYYIGDIVMLNTGEAAQISFINYYDISKPIVIIDNVVVDLSKEDNLYIECLL